MRKYLSLTTLATLAMALLPSLAFAKKAASDLVVVADTRLISSGIMRYLANLYNENITLFAIWAIVITALLGCTLGVIMDIIMKQTGLDLTKRKIVEH